MEVNQSWFCYSPPCNEEIAEDCKEQPLFLDTINRHLLQTGLGNIVNTKPQKMRGKNETAVALNPVRTSCSL